MIQSVIRYVLAAATAFLAGKGVLTEGQDLGTLTIEQGVVLLVTVGGVASWSFIQKKFFPKKEA